MKAKAPLCDCPQGHSFSLLQSRCLSPANTQAAPVGSILMQVPAPEAGRWLLQHWGSQRHQSRVCRMPWGFSFPDRSVEFPCCGAPPAPRAGGWGWAVLPQVRAPAAAATNHWSPAERSCGSSDSRAASALLWKPSCQGLLCAQFILILPAVGGRGVSSARGAGAVPADSGCENPFSLFSQFSPDLKQENFHF